MAALPLRLVYGTTLAAARPPLTSAAPFSFMNLPRPRARAWLVLAALFLATLTGYALRPSTKLDAASTEAAVTALTTNLLEKSQYAHHPLDQALVDRFLDRYLDALDGSRLIFFQSDVKEFMGKYRTTLAAAMRRQGDDSAAHAIFQRYLERLDQHSTYVNDTLAKEQFDFTGTDRYQADRKEAARPADAAAAQELWHQQLRADYLQEKLGGKKPEEIVQTLQHRAARTLQSMRKLSRDAVLEMYLEELAHAYDPHSDYMGHEELETFNMEMKLSLAGIGASLQSEDGNCKIRELIPGGPAAKGGQLKVGDVIVGVAQGASNDFTDLVDLPLPQAVELIRGPKGTSVKLSILPGGAASGAARKTVTIVRDEIKLEDQQAKAHVIDLPGPGGGTQRIGVLDLPGFYSSEGTGKGPGASATADVSRLLKKLQQDKIKGLVLDLRRNGGGSLDEAIDIVGLFIPSGPAVQTRDLGGRVEVSKVPRGGQLYDGPLVVLISRFSASASEIVAGALQDYGRAVIVGDSSTFGKGTVQTMVPLDRLMQEDGMTPSEDPGALKVTISKFYRPSGKSTQLEGVKADVVLPSPSDIKEVGESELLNPLPWDTIPAAKFAQENRVYPYLAALRARSAERIGRNPDFADLKAEIEHDAKMRADKTLSLNEEERRKEKAENDAREKAIKAREEAHSGNNPPSWDITLKNVDKPGVGEPVKPTAKPVAAAEPSNAESDEPTFTDYLILGEAEHLLGDYIELLQAAHAGAVTKR